MLEVKVKGFYLQNSSIKSLSATSLGESPGYGPGELQKWQIMKTKWAPNFKSENSIIE